MPDLTNTDLGRNYRKTAPSSRFGTRDMAFYAVVDATGESEISFPVTFLNNTYTQLFVGTNGYITFGGGSSNYDFGDDPTGLDQLPGILISEYDNSYQFVYSKTTGDAYNNTRKYTVRYEGTSNSSATNSPPNMIWEVTFYEDKPGIVDLVVISDANNRGGDGISGVTDGTNWVDNFFGGNQQQGWGKGSYRIDTTDGTTAVVTPGTAVEQGSGGMQIEHQFNHDTNGSTNEHAEDNDYVQVYGNVWNGSTYAQLVRALQQAVELYYIGQPAWTYGLGVAFVVAIADDTTTYQNAQNALNEAWGMAGLIPMVVGPESIYLP